MKFESVLQFNAVPDWADKYIAYHNLKKIIYLVEKEQYLGNNTTTYTPTQIDETTPIYDQTVSESTLDYYGISISKKYIFLNFINALDKDLNSIDKFYQEKEKEMLLSFEILEKEYTKYRKRFEEVIEILDEAAPNILNSKKTLEILPDPNRSRSRSILILSQNESSHSEGHSSEGSIPVPAKRYRKSFSILNKSIQQLSEQGSEREHSDYEGFDQSESLLETEFKIKLRQASARRKILSGKARELFIALSDLQTFSKLNYTGFTKILKKFEKVTKQSFKQVYTVKTLDNAYVFSNDAKIKSNNLLSSVIALFTTLDGFASQQEAIEDLKTSLRDQVFWDRNTVWRDLISMERKVGAVEVLASKNSSDSIINISANWSKEFFQILTFSFCSLAFIIALMYNPFVDLIHQRCWALLIFVSLLWATEPIPLHVTAMFVPLLVVTLNVLKDPETQKPLAPPDSAKFIFSSMFSSVIMLLLGGFTLAAALSKHNIARLAASYILSKVNNTPESILLANMFVATFASMWISNVAAPVLCFSLIQPILRTLPDGHSLGPCLIIGIALASNVGGMASPIASPQNIIAIGIMNPAPSWLQWLMVTIPTCIIINVCVWFFLLLIYKPSKHPTNLNRTRFIPEKFNASQWYVIAISIMTIILWCMSSSLSGIFGDMGVIAILPILLLFASSLILSKEDFNNFLWTVVILAMGGTALGKAVQSSGLLREISNMIAVAIEGLSPYTVMVAFCGLVLVICTFVSHTVGALIVLPIVYEVGLNMPGNFSRILVMASALMASGAMGLPVSGFPNMNAIMLEDAKGKPYLTVKDFFVAGIPSTIPIDYFAHNRIKNNPDTKPEFDKSSEFTETICVLISALALILILNIVEPPYKTVDISASVEFSNHVYNIELITQTSRGQPQFNQTD
ncbi:hypothetical protein BB561_001183 [Smittium simulii]|uniref:SPX domain-containing protein n=1 Tax=Smittium simulii TaxID=133385 RepID=A0A2T9YVS4_9FUNG|nr:hypothetical protein BB561_001183 [Smittium simulii]